jgi:ribose transport system ATP-binding protein
MTDALLKMCDITKSFPGVLALDNVALEVASGEIHGLVGENGAGKSTIIKVLAGVYKADAGTVEIDGHVLPDVTPRSVHDAGVRFIHQELHLVQHFTVTESVFMGQEEQTLLGLSTRAMRQKAEAFFETALGTEMSGNTLIRDLGIAERKLVQIARALIDNQAKLVVFDEPTAPLTSGETDKLFTAIRKLKEQGIAMIYVSHYLAEITGICDRVTVLRNGQNAGRFDEVFDDSAPAMISAMVGREIDELFPKTEHTPAAPRFEVTDLSAEKFEDVSFTIHRNEIVGVAQKFRAPADAVGAGIALVPRDRRHDGLVLDMSVSDNINLAALDTVSRGTLENRRAANAVATDMSETLDIRPRNIAATLRLLSGGNQQKVVLGRWLNKGADIFILDEPTVGVDVGAKVEIYQHIENLAQDGVSVLVSSSDPGELIGLCDRILVMLRGKIVAEVSTTDLGVDELVALTTGGATQEAVS